MSSRYGGKIVTDGLVLCLDAHDAKSYAGEPTTNVVTYTNLNTGWSKGYQSNIVYNDIEPPAGISSQVVGHTRGNNSGFWFSYGDYAPQDPSVEYVVSMYVKTLDSNFRIAFYTADNGEAGRYWSSYITVPNDGKWHRVVWDSFTNPSNSQSDSLSFNFSYNGAIGNASTKTWFCAPQMEAKSYATPFVDGTRSATNGWVDRTGNSTGGTLTNMIGTGASHYRAGQVIMPIANSYLDFDGTNDYIDLGTTAGNFGTDPFTVSIWLKFDVITNFFNKRAADQDQIFFGFSGGKPYFIYNAPNGTDYGYTVSNTSLSTGVWYNLVATVDRSSVYPVIYVNGSNDGSSSQSSAGSPTTANMDNGGSLYLGRWTYANTTDYFNGQMSQVLLYKNKALTAAEVLSNYNTTKGRFT